MRPTIAVLIALCVLAGVPADAGHELSFYPSFYPQEIRIETHDPAAAAALLRTNRLHAYVGADPFAGAALPAPLQSVTSLGSYLVLTFRRDAGASPDARCAAARTILAALAPGAAPFTFHPYPVTPYDADYLHHFDRVEAAKTAYGTASRGQPAPAPRLRAVGPRAEALARRHWPLVTSGWDATLEEVALSDLGGRERTSLNGRLGPPWIKEGWSHAYLLQRDALADGAARQAVDALFHRLTSGQYAGPVEQLDLERELVARLGAACGRVVVGYATTREAYTTEFSEGIENVAADSQTGLNSAIFVRTAKLKDFPWNGWLTLGVPAGAAAAWNPVAGFTDPTGRLVWSALGDPAFLPAPRGASWIPSRVSVVSTAPATEVPPDALLPEPGTGRWRPLGRRGQVGTKLVFRVLASAFHDGSRMTPADTLYGLSVAYRWGAPGGPQHDPGVEAGTALLRDWLAGLKLVRVDTLEREFGEVKFTTVVQTFEVYARRPLGEPGQLASAIVPWSTVPWTVLALAEMAVEARAAAFSDDEARRLGVPWLDLVRDRRVTGLLAPLVDEFAQGGYVPAALVGQVTADEAKGRWTALKAFYLKHGHFLATNGPYRLASWSDGAVVLTVFRDLAYPLGVGFFDRYPIPRRAYPAKIEVQAGRLEVQADVDVVQKFQREYRILPEPLGSADVDASDMPVGRYVALGADGRVVATGALPYAGRGRFAVDLARLPGRGPLTLLVALTVRDNAVDPEIRMLTVERP